MYFFFVYKQVPGKGLIIGLNDSDIAYAITLIFNLDVIYSLFSQTGTLYRGIISSFIY